MKISVCVPTYKSIDYIREALESVLKQTYQDFEVILCNDSPSDHEALSKLLKEYQDPRINFFPNEKNLGYPLNMRKCVSLSNNEILFLMAQDDVILDKNLFQKIVDIFRQHPEVGVITRPYYWFEDDLNIPIRTVPKHSKRLISLEDGEEDIRAVLYTLGQLSGLTYKKSLITHEFNENIFPAHIYPFLSVMKTHKCYFMADYTVAVRTQSSQTIHLSSIYHPSPTQTWVEMFQKVLPEAEFKQAREICIKHITLNHEGMVQIKNYGHFQDLLSDIYYLIRFRPQNLFSLSFWFYALLTILMPRFVLRKIVYLYKNVFNRIRLSNR